MSDTTPTQQDINQRVDRLVHEEIYLCLSSLMSELLAPRDTNDYSLLEQVSELSYVTCSECEGEGEDDEGEPCSECEGEGTLYREIFEWWAVSSFLAHDLEERGEVILRDWGLCIWGRPTTGQAITLDCVIHNIARDLLSK